MLLFLCFVISHFNLRIHCNFYLKVFLFKLDKYYNIKHGKNKKYVRLNKYWTEYFKGFCDFFFDLKVKGDNYRRTKDREKGLYTFEVGFDLFTQNPKTGNYKEMDEWWLVEMTDIVHELEEPTVVKVTSKRFNYMWDKIF